jgi:hypothetical protein
MDYDATWIQFIEGPAKPKTKTWLVVPKDSDSEIGTVAWFGRWRQYCFFPKASTVYERKCLREIASFCEERTKDFHRARKVA